MKLRAHEKSRNIRGIIRFVTKCLQSGVVVQIIGFAGPGMMFWLKTSFAIGMVVTDARRSAILITGDSDGMRELCSVTAAPPRADVGVSFLLLSHYHRKGHLDGGLFLCIRAHKRTEIKVRRYKRNVSCRLVKPEFRRLHILLKPRPFMPFQSFLPSRKDHPGCLFDVCFAFMTIYVFHFDR